ncbi:acrylyl-CoA reductase (NADPH) [Paraperlucidibaca baekdonensis]|uniref:Acrylyl-CoA reductase (NADPH) n=1 Tax=Paraperlucidibaca baekdonensis TaxID=748120 RepID=A0A3E0H163_9GAMM|nr:MDR family oxidoreductase [Paraperlucidibaca baekdonensis]REH36764.1 acrylyl-CoA reductase (NADPH) [Paraperlucidibaca baekdonensis]
MFNALYLTKTDAGFAAAVQAVSVDDLPEASVRIAVAYSTLNYKDGLAITNRSPVVRQWPMVAGIDGAGEVLESSHPAWRVGDQVILNGFGVGETHWGCLSQQAALNGDWLVRRPEAFSARDAMVIGTAGYTAMLSVMALEQQGITPEDGEVLVTGASGGVGSVAVALLAHLGYRVVAATGSASAAEFLTTLGAQEIIERNALSTAGKPLQKERWAGVIDSVGSHTLANACAQTRYGGAVTACGLAQGMDFPASVAPFILRGVRLIGIDSVMAPLALRERAWQRLARDLSPAAIATIGATEVGLSEAIAQAQALMDGHVRGRVVVDVNR